MDIMDQIGIYVNLIDDERNKSYIKYTVRDIVFMIMCAMLCGAKTLEEIVEILEYKKTVIRKYIETERILCIATFSNILSMIKPEQMQLCIIAIMRNVLKIDKKYNSFRNKLVLYRSTKKDNR